MTYVRAGGQRTVVRTAETVAAVGATTAAMAGTVVTIGAMAAVGEIVGITTAVTVGNAPITIRVGKTTSIAVVIVVKNLTDGTMIIGTIAVEISVQITHKTTTSVETRARAVALAMTAAAPATTIAPVSTVDVTPVVTVMTGKMEVVLKAGTNRINTV